MLLPIPYEHKGGVVCEAEFRRPSGAVLADTRKVADGGDVYSALSAFVAGSVDSLSGDGVAADDRQAVRAAVKDMPYEDANWSAIQVLLLLGVDDELDQVWQCPRCHHKFYSDPEYPDRIGDLPTETAEGGEVPRIAAELSYPVEVSDSRTGEAVVSAGSLLMRFPTLGDCQRAFRSVGGVDRARLQYAVFANALLEVDGSEVDDKFRQMWGQQLFERMDVGDLRRVVREAGRYGLAESVRRVCPQCGKAWDAQVDTSGFFASGLRDG